MTYEMYRNIFMICAVAGGVMVVVSILLFALLRIPSVIGDLTGITAKRGIEQIRSGNSKAALSKKRKKQKNQGYEMNTERLQVAAEAKKGETAKLKAAGNETTLLDQEVGSEVALLSAQAMNETTLLNMPTVNETTILPSEFGVLEEITILHTEEEI